MRENLHRPTASSYPGRSWCGAVTPNVPPVLGELAPIELANTRYTSRGGGAADALSTAEDLAVWLGRVADRLPAGLAAAAASSVQDEDTVRARALREALRSLLTSAAGRRPLDVAAAAVVNAAAAAGPGWVELDAGDGAFTRVRRFSAPAPAAVRSFIAQEAVELLSAGAPVLACATPSCTLFFLKDHPRRTSCSPACSDRARSARRYVKRQHG